MASLKKRQGMRSVPLNSSPVADKNKKYTQKIARYDADTTPNMVYVFACDGKDEAGICKSIGVTIKTFRKWLKKYSPLKEALQQGWEKARPELALPAQGRPCLYNPDKHNPLAEKLSKLGLDDKMMSEALGIGETTYYRWQVEFPDFRESIHKGKIIADAEVASKLYERAVGFTQKVLKIVVDKETGVEKELVDETYFPPDTRAQMYWLGNRRRAYWGKNEHDEGIKETEFNIFIDQSFDDEDASNQSKADRLDAE